MEGNQIEEFANMIPCPVAGCLWYSGSSTLYVHLFSVSLNLIITLIKIDISLYSTLLNIILYLLFKEYNIRIGN